MKISRFSLLISCLFLAGCTASAIAMLDAIVVSGEVIINSLPNLPPADTAKILSYTDSALAITNGLLDSGTTPATIAKAVDQFNALVVPQLSHDVPQSTVNLVSTLAASISIFVNTYKGAILATGIPHIDGGYSFAEPPKTVKVLPLTKKEKKKVAQMRARILMAKAKIEALKYKK